MTIFDLARLPRTELIARYLDAYHLTGEDCPGGVLPNVTALSRERLAAAIWEATHAT